MAFARSAAMIERDLVDVKPTLMCSVPRVYERIYQRIRHELAEADEKRQYLTEWAEEAGWRRFAKKNDLPVEHTERENLDDTVAQMLDDEVGAKIREIFGGRLRATFAGGASLNYTVAKFFSAMGLNILHSYGLTETSPIVSMSTPDGNHPACVGFPVEGTQVRLGEMDELQVKGPQVMKGYWQKPEETARAFTADGWFRTGDQADLSDGGRVRIKGRLKEIIVTSTGEKIPPVDVEFAVQADRLFELGGGERQALARTLRRDAEGSGRHRNDDRPRGDEALGEARARRREGLPRLRDPACGGRGARTLHGGVGAFDAHDEAAPPGDSGPLRGLGREPLRGAQDRVIRI